MTNLSQDNLAKVVSILFAKVVREKEIYEKLRAEIHSTDISNYEDLKKLKYTDMVGTKNAMREHF